MNTSTQGVPFDKTLIPHKPGVYIFKDENGLILYVGKAVNLFHRVSSYFNRSIHDVKTTALVLRINSCETIEVSSEVEALLLEANLIKKFKPPFNIKLTDDKDYLYIIVTKEDYPRVLTARKSDLKSSKEYFGPFPSSTTVRTTLRKLRRTFPWCANPPKTNPPKTVTGRYKPCFYYHLKLCPGPCAGLIDKHEYQKRINLFIKFMEGKKDELLTELTKQMDEHARQQSYEQAEDTKKIIQGINYLTQNSRIDMYLENHNFLEDENKKSLDELRVKLKLNKLPERIECYDISNIQGKEAVGSMTVLINGETDNGSYRRFKIRTKDKPDDYAMIGEVLKRRVGHTEWPSPDLILIDGGRGQVRAAFRHLSAAGWTIPVYGLAKRMEWLYPVEGEVLKLPLNSLSMKLLRKLRDEAHRFAVNYHRLLRRKRMLP